MILLKYRFERNLLIYFSLAYSIARGFIRAKKKEKLIGILIAGHTSPVTTPFFLPRINGFLQENTSPLSPSPIFVSQVQNGENFPEIVPQTLRACLNIAREKTVLASVIRGMHGPTCLDQRDSRLAMGIGIFSHAYSNWIASLSLSFCRRASCTTTDGKKRKKDTTRVLMDFDRKYETDVTWREWAAKRIREGNYRCATGKWKRNTRCSSVDVAGRMREMEFRVCLSFPWSPPLSFISFSSFFFFLSFLDY